MPPRTRPTPNTPTRPVGELSAVLGAAYECFLRGRLERRQGRRGKVHARAAKSFIESVVDMIEEAGAGGHDPGRVWQMAIADLARDRAEIEADLVGRFCGPFEFEHEWPAFLDWVGQVRLR